MFDIEATVTKTASAASSEESSIDPMILLSFSLLAGPPKVKSGDRMLGT
jgi:hypothetical protein